MRGETDMRIALGPVLYFWPRETVFAFYEEVARWPVDTVYLGEVVCSKRRAVTLGDWIQIAGQLQAAGKEVIFSTLALLEAESELKSLRRQVERSGLVIEANDLAAVAIARETKAPFVAGPHLNMYNADTLAWLASCGARRWVMPVELSREILVDLQAQRPAAMETEVFVWGRLPLAFSARCFTARTLGLPKDECGLSCIQDVEGRRVRTREAADFLTINGIQTQSALRCNLIDAIPEMRAAGVDMLRISPGDPEHTGEVVAAFRAVLEGALPRSRLADEDWCNGYWYGRPGMERVTPSSL